MIESASEDVFPLSHAPDVSPRLRRGKKINVATFYRWSRHGCRGVVLETLQCGGVRCTSREAIQRFFKRLTEARSPHPVGSAPEGRRASPDASRSASLRQTASERADRILKAGGS
jgi:hypothetical protein